MYDAHIVVSCCDRVGRGQRVPHWLLGHHTFWSNKQSRASTSSPHYWALTELHIMLFFEFTCTAAHCCCNNNSIKLRMALCLSGKEPLHKGSVYYIICFVWQKCCQQFDTLSTEVLVLSFSAELLSWLWQKCLAAVFVSVTLVWQKYPQKKLEYKL